LRWRFKKGSHLNDVRIPEQLPLEGEGDFATPAAGGKARLSLTDDAPTPYGGLVP